MNDLLQWLKYAELIFATCQNQDVFMERIKEQKARLNG